MIKNKIKQEHSYLNSSKKSTKYILEQANNTSISNLRRFERGGTCESRRPTEIYTKGQARERVEEGAGCFRFPRGVPRVRWPWNRAVHYFSMSNKAISMCPDQGPRVLTRVISPGSPVCATSSSETNPPPPSLPPLSILPPLLPGRHPAHHVTILSPPPPPSPKRRRREKSTTKRGESVHAWRNCSAERNEGRRRRCPARCNPLPREISTKALRPAVNECYITLLML